MEITGIFFLQRTRESGGWGAMVVLSREASVNNLESSPYLTLL